MLVEKLRVGYHVSSKEKDFVETVVLSIRQGGYRGPVEVVGSRAEGHRISTGHFYSQFEGSEKWLSRLDNIARRHDLSAGNIKDLVNFLPRDATKEVRRFLGLNYGHLDADLDLLVNDEEFVFPANLVDKPFPEGSGLVVDIFRPGDYIKESVFNY
ncbi:MAG TPA: hypothetical protein VF828_01940 [Patescibacteria group bacterium]